MADSGSKTERATPKKRKDERKEGNVFSSKDIITVLSILALFSVLRVMFPFMYGRVTLFFKQYLNYLVALDNMDIGASRRILIDCIIECAILVIPLLLLSILISVIATGAQTRFLFSMKSLKPKFSRMDPLKGFKRLVSLRSFVEVIKGLIKIAIIVAVIINFFQTRIHIFAKSLFTDLTQTTAYLLSSVMTLVYSVSIIFVFIAGLDFIYQRWDYERQIKMSKQEVKEEYKQMEGDPQIKGKIKERQRRFAMSRMMQSIPEADVVIKNPTHFAVALKYDIEVDEAPKVLAKGQDEVALRMIRVAEQNQVEVVENRELARALFASSEIGMQIPPDYYAAIAEILAVIYSMKNKN